jgi:hypothetical protein
MNEKWIIGIQISDRVKEASRVQDILTTFGCSIKTRLGLHDEEDGRGENGLIILEMTGNPEEIMKLENALLEVENLEVQRMIFSKGK